MPRSALYCRSLVQEGTFGRVYKGTLELVGREQEVIIKTVTGKSPAFIHKKHFHSSRQHFILELGSKLKHHLKNVWFRFAF